MSDGYVPRRGDVVWLNFTPQAGREQAGRRPALVLSPQAYNGKVGLMLAVPVTSKAKGYPFEVVLPAGANVQGVVLADQVRTSDWRERRAAFAQSVPQDVLDEVTAKLALLLGM